MEPNQSRGMGPIAEDGHPILAGAMEGERRRAIASRNWLESAVALVGVGMAVVIGGAVVFAIVRALL